MHFGVNHVGIFLFTNLLLPSLLKSASSFSSSSDRKGQTRIVNLSSAGHRLSPIRFSDWNFKRGNEEIPVEERQPMGLPKGLLGDGKQGGYSPFLAYGQSKTGNILMCVELNARLRGKGLRSWALHPGSIWTGLARNLDDDAQNLIKATAHGKWKTIDQGAATVLVAAFDPALREESGVYLVDCQISEAADFATDKVMAERLWTLSEQLVGEKFRFVGVS